MVNSQISDVKIAQSMIKVTKISYENADKEVKENEVLSELSVIAASHKAFRNDNGAIKLDLPNVDVKVKDNKVNIKVQLESESRELVAEMMVIAGRAVAKFAIENKISMPFLTQEVGSFSEETINNKDNLTFSQAFQATRSFKRSKILFFKFLTQRSKLSPSKALSCLCFSIILTCSLERSINRSLLQKK